MVYKEELVLTRNVFKHKGRSYSLGVYIEGKGSSIHPSTKQK